MEKFRVMIEKYPELETLLEDVINYFRGTYNKEIPIRIAIQHKYYDIVDEDADYDRGVFDVIINLVLIQEQKLIKESRFKDIMNIKYAYDIIRVLNDSKLSLSHTQLKNKLGVSKSNLSNIMKKVEPYNIVNTIKLGRKKLYSASQKGKEFYFFVKKNYSDNFIEETNEDEVLKQVSKGLKEKKKNRSNRRNGLVVNGW